jgi:hypothetical protein
MKQNDDKQNDDLIIKGKTEEGKNGIRANRLESLE